MLYLATLSVGSTVE